MKKTYTLLALIFVPLLALEGCRSATPQRSSKPTGARPPIGLPPASPIGGDANTAEAPGSIDDEEGYRPSTPSERKKVAVILGPGGAKSFAHIGVLKALQQQRIPIEKVVGLEWGALMGGLFAVKGTTHDAEWKLYKMEQQNPLQPKGFFSRSSNEASISVMDNFLNDSFGREDIGKAKIPFSCPSRSLTTGAVAWQTRGGFKEAVKRCLPYPPIFKAEGTFVAGPSQASEAVEALVREGFNVIILVNVLGSAMPVPQENVKDNLNHVQLWQEVKRAIADASRLNIDTINVDTSKAAMTQFNSKKDLISLGEAAGQKAAGQLINKYGF